MESEKKATERQYLDLFIPKCEDFPAGSITSSETPDFLVDTSAGILGIEIRRFYGASSELHPLQANESLEEQVVRLAEETHRGRGGPPLLVGIFFDNNFSLSKRRVGPLAERIAELVESRTPPETGGHERIEHDWFSRSDPVPEEIDRIHLWRYPGTTARSWTRPAAGWYAELSPEQVQAEIDKKTPHYAACQRKAKNVWLLLVVPGDAPSSLIELTTEAQRHVYSTPFQRVYFLEAFDRRVKRLRVSGG